MQLYRISVLKAFHNIVHFSLCSQLLRNCCWWFRSRSDMGRALGRPRAHDQHPTDRPRDLGAALPGGTPSILSGPRHRRHWAPPWRGRRAQGDPLQEGLDAVHPDREAGLVPVWPEGRRARRARSQYSDEGRWHQGREPRWEVLCAGRSGRGVLPADPWRRRVGRGRRRWRQRRHSWRRRGKSVQSQEICGQRQPARLSASPTFGVMTSVAMLQCLFERNAVISKKEEKTSVIARLVIQKDI